MTVLKNDDVPQSLLYITDGKPCTFDTTTAGVLSITPTDAEIVLDYGMLTSYIAVSLYVLARDIYFTDMLLIMKLIK